MRVTGLGLALLLAASSVDAQVHLVIKGDGSKIIYNVPTARANARTTDYNWLARQHDRRSRYDPLIEQYAKKYRVDPVLVRAVIQVESGFDPLCVSNRGARGLMQLMPDTAKRYGVTKIHDPDQNIRGGTQYLRDLTGMFSDLPRALAAYNAGENAVLRYGGIPPYEETSTYVKRALTVYYGHPYGAGVMFAGKRGPKTLKGGFTARVTQPLAAVMPGMRYLGSQ